MRAIEDQYIKFVLDALRDLQPVQVGEQRRDVVVKLCPTVRCAAALMTD